MINKRNGFTLIELIMVIVILGVIAVYVAPKFGNLAEYDVKNSAQDLVEAIRYTQHKSMTHSGADHFQIVVTSAGYTVTQNGSAIDNPKDSSGSYSNTWKTGITTTAKDISFNSRGNVCNSTAQCTTPVSADITITVTHSSATSTITIEEFTGYVHYQ